MVEADGKASVSRAEGWVVGLSVSATTRSDALGNWVVAMARWLRPMYGVGAEGGVQGHSVGCFSHDTTGWLRDGHHPSWSCWVASGDVGNMGDTFNARDVGVSHVRVLY